MPLSVPFKAFVPPASSVAGLPYGSAGCHNESWSFLPERGTSVPALSRYSLGLRISPTIAIVKESRVCESQPDPSEGSRVLFSARMRRFAQQSPMSVLARMTLDNLFGATVIDEIFDDVARKQYTRELLFSTAADLLVQVTLFGMWGYWADAKALKQANPG